MSVEMFIVMLISSFAWKLHLSNVEKLRSPACQWECEKRLLSSEFELMSLEYCHAV